MAFGKAVWTKAVSVSSDTRGGHGSAGLIRGLLAAGKFSKRYGALSGASNRGPKRLRVNRSGRLGRFAALPFGVYVTGISEPAN